MPSRARRRGGLNWPEHTRRGVTLEPTGRVEAEANTDVTLVSVELQKSPPIRMAVSGRLMTAEFRLPCEPVRHKMLDIVGDMALAGMRLNAHVVGDRSGHELNRRLAARLRAARDGEVAVSAGGGGAGGRGA